MGDLIETVTGENVHGAETLSMGGLVKFPVQDIQHVTFDDTIEPVEKDSDISDDDEDGGTRLEWNEESKPRKISQKKRTEIAGFGKWLEEHREQVSKETADRMSGTVEEKSVNYLMKDMEGERIITNPRDYQVELFERAKQMNTIAVLDTGSGKTLIAALLLKWVIDNELEDRDAGYPKRISFFLVDKVALVFQQHAVLECNLDHPVEKFCGSTLHSSWRTKGFWENVVNNNMVVVCTAEILRQCLHHAYIRMDQINLLIFDEAHHAKKEHPYAKIILDFYNQQESQARRPRVFGMTASPVDAKMDLTIAAIALEELLHSTIATASDPAVLKRTVSKPKKEETVTYDRLGPPYYTDLTLKLHGPLGSNKQLSKLFEFSRKATTELGPWCADRIWQRIFLEGDDELLKLEARSERDYALMCSKAPQKKEYQSLIGTAKPLVLGHSFDHPRLIPGHFSSKVRLLLDVLGKHFAESDSNTRCIVFVQRRLTAYMLADLLRQRHIGIPNLRVGSLTGSASGANEDGFAGISFKQQIVTIMKFKRGELNCLISTSVGEEGLDIPDCNLIIRFDLYDTMIQYIQSRGRARHENSTYIHMVEEGNGDHRRRVHQNTQNETLLRDFCIALPDDRKLEGNDRNMNLHLRKEINQRQYTVKSTGAKLTFKQSLATLAAFASSLPHADEISLVPTYIMSSVDGGGFICEVMLPGTSPVRNALGRPLQSKQAAKCSAAFEMCLELIRKKYLDEHLRPIFTKQLPIMANARLNLSSKKKDQYAMRPKPELWRKMGRPGILYVTALVLSTPDALDKPSRPLLLLTRGPVPPVAGLPLFFAKERSSPVEIVPLSTPIHPTGEDLEGFTNFTLKIFKDVFSKGYRATTEELPYYIVPSRVGHDYDFSARQTSSTIIDWEALQYVHSTDQVAYEGNEPDDFFIDKYVTDPFDGSRKLYLRKVRRDLKPHDPVPEGVKPLAHSFWKTVPHTICNYSLNMWSKSRGRFVWKKDQPVIEADLITLRRNLLDERRDAEGTLTTCFVVLQPLHISPLPLEVVAMAYNLPAILYRLESSLIALDACKIVDLDIQPDLAIEAFTKDSDNTDEHDQEPLNFQAGMGKNYERLEFLGDSFLKMATTVSLYTLIPDKSEFDYHVERMCLICNKNLFNNALELNIQEYIRSKAFSRRTWYPDNLEQVSGKKTEEKNKNTHVLADKSIADVCEALIGAAYMTGREKNDFNMAVQAVSVVVNHKNHRMKTWDEYYDAYAKPDWQTGTASAAQLDLAKKIKEKMGYDFKYPRLLRCAFRHPSYPHHYEGLPSYQRLEFLGDALLDMAIVDYLYLKYPTRDPQWLTEHKMAIVSNQFLGCLAVSLGFHKHMLSFHSVLQKKVLEYVVEITEAKEQAEEEVMRTNEVFAWDYWVNVTHPPKCLADLVEAYIGAIFVDSKYDYSQVQAFFDRHVLPYFRDMSIYDTFANKHPVTFCSNILGQTFHCNGWGVQIQEIPVTEGEGLVTGATKVVAGFLIHGQVVGHGISESGRYAKVYAAKVALKKLQSMTVFEFRDEFKCTCIPEDTAADEVLEHGTAV